MIPQYCTNWTWRGLAVAAAFATIIFGAWWSATYNLDLRIAVGGFSPMHYIGLIECPECFTGDSDLGDMFGVSLLARVYEIGYALSIAPYTMQLFVVALEALAMAVVVFWGAVRVFGASPAQALFTVALVMTSSALHLNLGGWRPPIFSGLPYGLAQASQVLGILLYLERRPVASGLCLALAFSIHPAIGGLGVAFVAAMTLAQPHLLRQARNWVGGVISVGLIFGWLSLAYNATDLAAPHGVVSDSEWIAINRMLNFHFFPDERGLLSTRADAILLPWFAASILAIHYMRRLGLQDERGQMVLGGFAIAALLAMTGTAAAAFDADPALIRLTLIRATEFAGTIGIFYIGRGLYQDISGDNLVRSLLALIVLVSVFSFPRYPILPVLLLAAFDGLEMYRRRQLDAAFVAEAALAVVLIGLVLFYVSGGTLQRPGSWIVFGDRPFARGEWWIIAGGTALVCSIGIRWAIHVVRSRGSSRAEGRTARLQVLRQVAFAAGIALALGIMGGHYLWTNRSFARPQTVLDWAADYKDAQLWARQTTEPGTIFMPDPTIYYGWRDYSWRPSFGNMFEWLRQPVLYRVNEAAFLEGRKRFAEFDLDLEIYKAMRPDMKGYIALDRDLKQTFYSKKESWFLEMAESYGIGYAVLDLSHMGEGLSLPVAFKNRNFVIYDLTQRP